MSRRVVIVGGGVSGLAAAHRLLEIAPGLDVLVLEENNRLGGLIGTEHTHGYVVELGADAFITDKPAGIALVERLGLERALISTNEATRGAYVVAHGKLVRVPEGLSLLAPTRLRPLLRSPVLSMRGKLRASFDLFLPRGAEREDESLASFVRRRFGTEMLERFAQPLAAGIYGADPERLSLRATMPRFLEMEQRERSVSLGLRKKNQAASGARYGLFASFEGGMQTLIDALAKRVEGKTRTSAHVERVSREGDHYVVALEDGSKIACDAIVLAVPAHRAAELVLGMDADLSADLTEIPYGSSATVTFAFDRTQVLHPLDAAGFVVPEIEQREILASTWASQKFAGRAPRGKVLIRVFLGGANKDAVASWEDERLIGAARRELDALVGVSGAPELVRVRRYLRALPRYHVGHLARVAAIEARAEKHPGFALAGNAYRGVGIPDAIKSGESAAEAIAAHLRG